jgi:hypothetical protein
VTRAASTITAFLLGASLGLLGASLGLLGVLALPPPPAVAAEALVTPSVMLTAALTPEDLGGGTTIHFSFSITAPEGQIPSPPVKIDLLYPANLGIANSGLGLSDCRVVELEADGPSGCPVDSVMGFGSGVVEVPFGPDVLREAAQVVTFMAPLHDEHFALLFYTVGESPVAAQLVFPGFVLPASAPFGGDLSTEVPLVPTLPEAPDASLVYFNTTLGPSHITYYEYARGRSIPYRPRGIRLPRTCPHGGFRFSAQFTFQNETHAAAQAVVPCPRPVRPRRHARR